MAGGPIDLWNWPIDLWNHWSIQIVVLVSLTLQVVLLVFAEIRRREVHLVRRIPLWSAYLLADSTAIYALGHLSFSSVPREHRLVAFWAPFLLMHLGGPDNITAYALQDNELWLRHLLTLVVQVLGAIYVLYKHIAANGTFVLLAAILIFAVGFVKYAERTLALQRGDLGSIRSSVKKESRDQGASGGVDSVSRDQPNIRSSLKKEPRTKFHFCIEDEPPHGGFKGKKADEEEFLVRRAHSLFHICKYAIVDSSVLVAIDDHDAETFRRLQKKGNHKDLDDHDAVIALMEIELSLLYDIIYTKAAVIHSMMFGYLFRAASPLVIAASLLLFHFSGKDGHSRVDVAITYVLLAGAFLLEMISLLSALGSSWTLAFLCATRCSWIRHEALCAGRWDRFRRVVVSFHHFVNITGISSFFRLSRRWSRTMGQYNMLHRCTGSDSLTRLVLGSGTVPIPENVKEWWVRWHYSGTVPIPENVKKLVYEYTKEIISEDDVNTLGIIRNDWGKRIVETRLVSKLNKDVWESIKVGEKSWGLEKVLRHSLGAEFQEGIIIWHIGTDVFLARRSGARDIDMTKEADLRVEAIRVLSNYMMFLLVKRPEMLPGIAQTRLYDRIYECLVKAGGECTTSGQSRRNFCTTLQELFRLRDDPGSASRLKQRKRFARMLPDNKPPFSMTNSRLHYAIDLAEGLLATEKDPKFDSLGFVRDMWTDFLVYAANRCSRESHAKKLSSGGEFTTVIWLMTEHFNQVSLLDYRKRNPQEEA